MVTEMLMFGFGEVWVDLQGILCVESGVSKVRLARHFERKQVQDYFAKPIATGINSGL